MYSVAKTLGACGEEGKWSQNTQKQGYEVPGTGCWVLVWRSRRVLVRRFHRNRPTKLCVFVLVVVLFYAIFADSGTEYVRRVACHHVACLLFRVCSRCLVVPCGSLMELFGWEGGSPLRKSIKNSYTIANKQRSIVFQ